MNACKEQCSVEGVSKEQYPKTGISELEGAGIQSKSMELYRSQSHVLEDFVTVKFVQLDDSLFIKPIRVVKAQCT